MNFITGILNGLDEIWAHKLRSALTMICVLLGVASLVIISGFITGLFKNWRSFLEEEGGLEKVSVEAVESRNSSSSSPETKRSWQDVNAVISLAKHATRVSPEASLSEYNPPRRRDKTGSGSVRGVTDAAFAIDRLEVAFGRRITDLDVARANNIAVLGYNMAEELFPKGENPLGGYVTVGGLPCEVVGVLKKYEIQIEGGSIPLSFKSNIALIPITTMQWKINGNSDLSVLNIKIDDPERMRSCVDELDNIITMSHRKKVSKVETNQSSLQQLDTIQRNFMFVGGGVGAITLLVGGIGIMNLMLASINERYREIGVRKALGARSRDIFLQFLAEAVALSFLGGAFGALLGCGIIKLLQGPLTSYASPQISPVALGVGFGFSVLVGLISGMYPAYRAARLDPITALRYE